MEVGQLRRAEPAGHHECVPCEAHHCLLPIAQSGQMGDTSVDIGDGSGRGIVEDRQERVHRVTLFGGVCRLELLLLGRALHREGR
jgi:hypothetical protein